MKIIVINGFPQSGKDTFVQLCQKKLLWCLNVSTVDFVKEIATRCGWDGEKTPRNREFLSNLKDLLTDWDDVPYKKVEEAIRSFHATIEMYDFSPDEALVFIHCREPQEIKKLCERLNAESLLIRRAAVEDFNQSNHADEGVLNYNYDYVISNNSTIEVLDGIAEMFLQGLGFKNLKKN